MGTVQSEKSVDLYRIAKIMACVKLSWDLHGSNSFLVSFNRIHALFGIVQWLGL